MSPEISNTGYILEQKFYNTEYKIKFLEAGKLNHEQRRQLGAINNIGIIP